MLSQRESCAFQIPVHIMGHALQQKITLTCAIVMGQDTVVKNVMYC